MTPIAYLTAATTRLIVVFILDTNRFRPICIDVVFEWSDRRLIGSISVIFRLSTGHLDRTWRAYMENKSFELYVIKTIRIIKCSILWEFLIWNTQWNVFSDFYSKIISNAVFNSERFYQAGSLYWFKISTYNYQLRKGM